MKVTITSFTSLYQAILAARTCYNSIHLSDSFYGCKSSIGEKDLALLKRIIAKGHESVLEHIVYTFLVEDVSRTLTHQLVRHRIASYSQQSQRYVKVNTDNPNWYVLPPSLEKKNKFLYDILMDEIASTYNTLIEKGVPKEDARYVLPNATKTELVMSINARSFRNLLKLRTDKTAQWEIRELGYMMLDSLPYPHGEIYKDIVNK